MRLLDKIRHVLVSISPLRMSLAVGLFGGCLFAVSATAVSPLIGLLILAGIAVAISFFIWPYFGFLVTAAMVPLERFGRITNDDTSFTFSVMRAAGFLSLGAFLLQWFLTKRKLRAPSTFLWYAGYMALGVMSLSWTTDLHYGFNQTSMQLGNLMFFFVVLNIVGSMTRARAAITVWLVLTVAIDLYTIHQWYFGSDTGLVQDEDYYNQGAALTTNERFAAVAYDVPTKHLERQKRAIGTTSHPGAYALNLILALPFFFYASRTAQSPWLRIFWSAGVLLTIYNLMLTNTRSALFTLVFFIVAGVLTRLIKVKPWFVGVCAIGSVLAFSFAPTDLKHRIFRFDNWFSSDRDSSFGDRLYLMQVSLDIISEHVLLGAGLGNQVEVPKRARLDWRDRARSAHNDVIATLLEVGIVGFIMVALFLITLYRRMRFCERIGLARNDPELYLLMRAARVQFYCLLFFGLQAEPLTLPIKSFWLVGGIAVALSELFIERAKSSLEVKTVRPPLDAGNLGYEYS